MAGFSVNLELSGIKSFDPMLEFTNPKLYAKAVKGGIRYAAKAGVVQAAKSVGARYNLKAARIKQDIRVSYITADQATLAFSRDAPSLNQFGLIAGKRGGPQPGLGQGMGWGKPKPKGKPISAKIFRDGPRQAYLGAFLITGRNGATIPVRSKGGKLVAIYGPSVGSDIFGRGRYSALIQAEVGQRINEQFITGMQRVLDSASRGYAGG
jgi:hypothetical protein